MSGPSTSTPRRLVQFLPLHSVISPNFWHTLTNLKLNHLRLSEDAISVRGSYGVGRTVKDDRGDGGGASGTVGISAGMILDESSFEVGAAASSSSGPSTTPTSLSVPTHGKLINFNTAPQFTSSDKNAIFNTLADEILTDLLTAEEPTDAIVRFTILAFADLKKYKYYHWVALPALLPHVNWCVTGDHGWRGIDPEEIAALRAGLIEHAARHEGESSAGFALVKAKGEGGQVTLGAVREFTQFFDGVPEDERSVLFVDPSSTPGVPGWPLRNLLALLSVRYDVRKMRVIAWRDDLRGAQSNSSSSSIAAAVYLPDGDGAKGSLTRDGAALPIAPLPSDATRPSATGWERNAQGKLAPKVADLGPLMDPKRLAEQAVDLNLKLMRWRVMPEIQLERISTTRCLLLGAGTLGCHVARILLGWGVRYITFVDSSNVSYSNPVRQPLFEFEDCTGGGRPKAECAAERLAKVFPGANTRGVKMAIPMPGHGLLDSEAESANAQRDVKQLEDLMDSHDAVFLLMDSRESRWLPTMLGSARHKLVINAALGFDTYLVMRHGGQPTQTNTGADDDYTASPRRLGCYFCNDVVAPVDSLTDRTLDQMCTVSRPGLAAIAGACAVELMVSVLQHPDGVDAPAPAPATKSSTPQSQQDATTCLGILPHQIRGQLANFSSTNITGSSFDKCTACSSVVVNEYRSRGWEMLRSALGKQGYLESLTGLDKMYEETERLLLSEGGVGDDDWSESDGDGE